LPQTLDPDPYPRIQQSLDLDEANLRPKKTSRPGEIPLTQDQPGEAISFSEICPHYQDSALKSHTLLWTFPWEQYCGSGFLATESVCFWTKIVRKILI
jgi:hypothetical protein